jgi:putative Ca2+/H+ antiporter (TMEM165/GDT1 family)
VTGWQEILVVALVAQLAVLPGEKVQFIIAGLSTRYDPKVVVAAAGSAFAGWTALEILFGQAVKNALPPLYLDLLTGALFFVFAVLLIRSAPAPGSHATPTQTDGGMTAVSAFETPTLLGRELPRSFGSFLPIFAMMAAGEFGDKTQLVTIGLAVQYGAHPAIWAGEMLAIIPVSIANAYFFHRFAGSFDTRKAHLFSAALFLFFAADVALKLVVGVSVWETLVGTVSGAVVGLL